MDNFVMLFSGQTDTTSQNPSRKETFTALAFVKGLSAHSPFYILLTARLFMHLKEENSNLQHTFVHMQNTKSCQ